MNDVLLDSDVVLDYVLERQPFDAEAKKIFYYVARKKFVGYMASVTPVNVFYIGRKIKGAEDTLKSIKRLLQLLEVCAADRDTLKKALNSSIADYEDAVQHVCAEEAKLDAIVTRNLSDFKNATIPVYSPADFLRLLQTP